jgi:hypothetical protein
MPTRSVLWRGLQPPFEGEKVKQSNWCWAAVAAAVGNHLRTHAVGARWEQCRIADHCLGSTTCCTGPTAADNVLHTLEDALAHVDCDPGQRVEDPNKPPQLARIGLHLAHGFPVCVRIRWNPPNDAHFVVITGCDVGLNTIDVFDPVHGASSGVDFETFPSTYRDGGEWTDTYYPIPLAGPYASGSRL